MKDEIVSFETAILAKEKGFDIQTCTFYCEKYGLCEEGEESLLIKNHPITKKLEIIYDVNSEFEEGERFYAVTQGLLQRWLREVHNIYIEIRLENSKDSIRFYVIIWNKPKGNHNTSSYTVDHMYDKYEIALEAGLFQALKLIK